MDQPKKTHGTAIAFAVLGVAIVGMLIALPRANPGDTVPAPSPPTRDQIAADTRKMQEATVAASRRALAATRERSAPPEPVQLADLWREFDENGASATRRYVGKRIATAGTVLKVNDSDGAVVVQLGALGVDHVLACIMSRAGEASALGVRVSEEIHVAATVAENLF